MDKHRPISGALRRAVFYAALMLLASPSAFAACSSPAGNAGDIVYGSNNVMAYCNGTSWVAMGNSTTVSFGTLTTGDFCTATSGTAIACTTAAINMASQVTGTLGVGNGGTGLTSITTNGIIYGNGASAPGITTAGSQYNVLVAGATGVPAFGQVNLAQSAAVTGVLAVANGGTGAASLTAHELVVGNGTSAVDLTAVGTTGTVLIGNTGADPSWSSAPAISGANITSLNASNITSGTVPTADLGSGTASSGTFLRGDQTWAAISVGTGSITGTLGVGQGGTGETSLTAHSLMLGEGASAVGTAGPGATGTVLVGMGASADPAFSANPSLTNLTLSGAEMLSFGADLSTTGTSTAVSLPGSAFRYVGTGTATFESIAAGTSGQIVELHNASAYSLTIADQSDSTDSTLANRIITGTNADLAMAANSSITMQYDGTTARWRVIGGSGGGGIPGGSDTQVQYNDNGAFAGTSGLVFDYANVRLGVGTSAPAYAVDVSTGTVAGEVMHVTPQSVSVTGVGGSGSGGAISAGTTGELAYYTGTSTISASSVAGFSGSTLSVAGPVVSQPVNDGSGTSIDFSTSNAHYTSASCGSFTLTGAADGGNYTLLVTGTGGGAATFTHSGLTIKTTGTLACTSGKATLFGFQRFGSNLYVTMSSGY